MGKSVKEGSNLQLTEAVQSTVLMLLPQRTRQMYDVPFSNSVKLKFSILFWLEIMAAIFMLGMFMSTRTLKLSQDDFNV